MTITNPAPPAKRTVDFGRAFTFTFEDPEWLKKVLIGGLFYLLVFLLIGLFFVFGYAARVARNVAAGVARPLPEWDDLGGFFGEGARLIGVTLIYYLPIVILAIVAFGGGVAIGSFSGGDDAAAALTGGLFSVGMCLVWILAIGISILLPAAITLAVMRQSFAAAFDFPAIFAYIKANAANYVLLIVVHIAANFIAQFGVILLCVGVLFTSFWALLPFAYALGETYRYSSVK